MSWPNGTFPPPKASVFFNSNGGHLQHGQVSNIDAASMVPLELTFPPAPTEALILSNMNGSHLHHGQEITPIIGQNTLNQEKEMVNPSVENPSRSKRRKLKSKVWDDFTKNKGEDGKEWAECNHCRKKFVGSSKSGTTHLKNHLERCPSKRNPGGVADKSMKISDCLTTSAVIKKKSMVSEEPNHLDETRMIIKYYWIPSLNSKKADILDVYREEKEKLRRYLNKLPCRFCLSVLSNCNYWFVTLYFIDDSWELKNRVIHFQQHEMEEDISESLKCLLVDLSIDKKIIYMINDQEEVIGEQLEPWFHERAIISFFGFWVPFSTFLDEVHSEIFSTESNCIFGKTGKLYDYVRKTSSNENNFRIAVEKAKSTGMKVNSQGVPGCVSPMSFEVFEWVIEVKEAFIELQHTDPDFKSINLIKEDWDYAISLYEFLKAVKDATRRLSDCKYKTANVYFPIVCNIFLKLVQWEKSVDQCRRENVSFLRKDFDKHWSHFNLILVISVILDPRFKMEIIELWYKEIYGDDANKHLEEINSTVTKIYKEYAKVSNNSKSSSSWDRSDTKSSTPLKMLDTMGRPCISPQHNNLLRSELDRYLKDSKCDRVEEFDILAWWRLNSLTYPTLTMMACDFLTIPLYAFDHIFTNSSLLDQLVQMFRDRNLDDDIKQPLACTKAWLYDIENK